MAPDPWPLVFPLAPTDSTLSRLRPWQAAALTPAREGGNRQNTNGGAQVPDPIAPPFASRPAEAVELVSLAVSAGDLEAALAQYEDGAVLRPWAHDPGGDAETVADALTALMDLRLPVSVQVCAIVPTDALALVLSKRHIIGTGPDCEQIQLGGAGATVVRRQQSGSWRIIADAWHLSGPGTCPGTQLIPARHQHPGAGTGS
jgi:ketosteroid isomerase-like protein